MQVLFSKIGIFTQNLNNLLSATVSITMRLPQPLPKTAIETGGLPYFGSGFLFHYISVNCSPKSSACGIAPAAGKDLVR